MVFANELKCWALAKKMFYMKLMIKCSICCVGLLFLCEYLIYYLVLMQCQWPELDHRKADPRIAAASEEKPVRAMFLADTHLLGSRNGYWIDKVKRELEMRRAFQTAMSLHKPEFVFVLGDLFNEGLWCDSEEFEGYVQRFHSVFAVPQTTRMYVVAGNHDIGFHYEITSHLNQRFVDDLEAPNVRSVTIRGNHFVLLNSMALEGDECFLCRPTEIAVSRIANQLECARRNGGDCPTPSTIRQYSRPILLQHFPMYRESNAMCDEVDEAPADEKDIKFKERYDCLSKNASKQLLDILTPRLILDGHTHHGCRNIHGEDTLEITIPSFSWRNKNNPSFLMGVFTPNNYAVAKCYMPVQSTVIGIYVFSSISILIYLIIKIKTRRRMNRRSFSKLY